LNSLLKNDFKKFILDTDQVQKYIEMLGQKKCVSAGGPQQRDLTQLGSLIVRLDFDLRTMLFDCAILGRQYWKKHNVPLLNSLHRSLTIMYNLFNDLNNLKPTLKETSIEPSNLRSFVMNWARFRNSVSGMRISLQHFDMRRKIT